MRKCHRNLIHRLKHTLFYLLMCPIAQAVAQSDNAILNARDAFGERVGVETAGIYTEAQVRGFSLANTGAYRIEGAYFVRDYTLPDSVLAGVSVKAGVNAARLAYPSPSGVVDYRLKSSKPGDKSFSATINQRELGQTVIDTTFSLADKDGKFGVAGGTSYTTPVIYPNEVNYKVHNVGFVPQWRPADNVRVRGLAAVEWSHYRGEQFFLSSVAALPPKLNYHNYGPSWTNLERTTMNTGVMVDATVGAWSLSATTFYADHRRSPADATLIVARPDRLGDAFFNRTNDQHSKSVSSEGVAAYRFVTGNVTNTLTAAMRNRRSRANTITLAPISLGLIDLTRDDKDGYGYGPEPAYPVPARGTQSDVDHLTGSVGYTFQLGQSLELRGGLHRSRYDKTVTSPLNVRTERLETRWLYNASAVLAVRSTTTLYANAVKGIEETGIAPQNARNRDEVLPPVVAEQFEVGVREAITPKLSLSVAGFEVKKMIPGLRADGVFTLVGDVRHRGGELSLTGEVTPGTTIVLGALAMKPRLSRLGAPTTKPVGVSSDVLVASVNHQLDWLGVGPGWSVDARLTWQSPRLANAAGSFKTLEIASLTVGTRYEFKMAGLPAQFRVVAVNAGTSRPWNVGPSGILTQTDPFRIRASLRVTFL